MEAFCKTVVSLLCRAGFSTIAARLRYTSIHPEAALAILSVSLVENVEALIVYPLDRKNITV